MNRTLSRILLIGVPGVGFVVAGAAIHEYGVLVAGGAMVGLLAYTVIREGLGAPPARENRQSWVSFSLASMIGVGIMIDGVTGGQYWLVVIGGALVIGSLLQLCRALLTWGQARARGGTPPQG
jgi:hypothetical protein